MFRVHVFFIGNSKHLDGVYRYLFTEDMYFVLEDEILPNGNVKQVKIHIPYTSVLFLETSEIQS